MNNTWNITNLPKDRNPTGCRWIYKIKCKYNGEIDRYKARLVAKWYNQGEGVDYAEKISHVAKLVTVRLVISLSINNNWGLFQLDVNNVFCMVAWINMYIWHCSKAIIQRETVMFAN